MPNRSDASFPGPARDTDAHAKPPSGGLSRGAPGQTKVIPFSRYVRSPLAGRAVCLSALAAALCACSSDDSSAPPTVVADASPSDGTTGDGAGTSSDSASADTGVRSDTGASDTGASDTGVSDTGVADAGASDTGARDGGALADAALDADAGGVHQQVTVTDVYADTSDAGLFDGGAVKIDPNLVNPWGLAFGTTGTAWISDNGTDLAATYTAAGTPGPFTVPIPLAPEDDAGNPQSRPTGQVFNGNAAYFEGDRFIISTEEGTIFGWQNVAADAGADAGHAPGIRYDGFAQGALFTGLAIVPQVAADGSVTSVLLATDFHNAVIDVLDANYHLTTAALPDGGAAWVDPDLPAVDGGATYAPFNVATQRVGAATYVYVAYVVRNSTGRSDETGPGLGIIGQFATDGSFVKNLVPQGGALDAPWALAVVPPGGWGAFPGNTLLVGNFGASTGVSSVNAYDAIGGTWLGNLVDTGGSPLAVDGLWALTFGVDTDAGELASQLYFTAGPRGQSHGLYGYLVTAP